VTDTADPYSSRSGPASASSWLIRSPIAYALLLLFGLVLFLPGFRSLPAVDRDEARFAQSSRQMHETGDYLHIRLQDEARLKKPVGIYWLQAAATALAGGEDPANPIWTYRLPSLAGALGAILITLALGRRWMGAEAGFVAAALLGASLLLGVEARQAKTDAFLLLTILVAMSGLAEAWIDTPPQPSMSRPFLPRTGWIAFWAALGAGILIKGPIILMVAGLTAAALALRDRRVGWLLRLRPWPGVAITLAIAAPWLIAITIASHGAFLTQSLGGDMATKLAGGQEAHGAPPGTYLALFPVTFWPGSLFALMALPWAWRGWRDRSVFFCLAWVVPSWVVFEMVPTKLPHYVLPLYPAVALLAGGYLADRLAAPSDGPDRTLWFRRAPLLLWAAIGIGLGVALAAAAPLGDGRPSVRGIVAALLAWGLTGAVTWLMWRNTNLRRDRRRALAAACVGAVIVWGAIFGAALPALDAPWLAPRVKELVFEKLPAGHGPVEFAGYREPSAVIAFGTDTRFGEGADAARLLADTDGAVAIVSEDQLPPFDAALADAHVTVESLGVVSGFNYAKGKRTRLTIYRRAQK
jgi:4-amino-4-deoxy-L-arabinose transferase-like glycosyltransferase